jgi:cytochrome c556
MMKLVAALATVAAACAFASPASAQFAKPEDAVKYRQSSMFVMANHFGRIGAMTSGRVPFDAKVAADNAEVVAELSKLPWAGYVAGTDKIGNTRAKAEIWSEQAKFKEYGDKMIADSGRMLAAAKSNNLDALKASFSSAAGTCKACHDAFRRD